MRNGLLVLPGGAEIVACTASNNGTLITSVAPGGGLLDIGQAAITATLAGLTPTAGTGIYFNDTPCDLAVNVAGVNFSAGTTAPFVPVGVRVGYADRFASGSAAPIATTVLGSTGAIGLTTVVVGAAPTFAGAYTAGVPNDNLVGVTLSVATLTAGDLKVTVTYRLRSGEYLTNDIPGNIAILTVKILFENYTREV